MNEHPDALSATGTEMAAPAPAGAGTITASAVPDRRTTDRGFVIYDEFEDTKGSRIRVQESSSAEGARCWVFVTGQSASDHPSPHLDIEQAIRLQDALGAFIREHGGQ